MLRKSPASNVWTTTLKTLILLKGKVKIRMMRNKTSYMRLTSIYEDTKGKL